MFMNLTIGINSVLFLDRDGVINKQIPDDYVKTPSEFIFEEGALEALKLLAPVFPSIVVVTNQQGIGRGIMTEDQLQVVHSHMLQKVSEHGGRIDGVYYCPHRSDQGCQCRKPAIGMFIAVKNKYPDLTPLSSVIVGDSLSDMQFGRNAGIKTILISHLVQTDLQALKLADEQFGSLFDFAKQIYNSYVSKK